MIKRFTLLMGLVASTAMHAQVNTTTGSGNFYNPLIWDCFCVPADGDTLVINHALIMSAPVYYTSGQITINASGSLLEDGSDRDVWVDGGSLINHGTFNCHRFYISDGFFINTGTVGTLDSLWSQADMENSGTLTVYDFLNDETANFENTGTIHIDNNFNNQGYFLNEDIIDVGNDFSNCNIQSMDAWFDNNGIFCIAQDFTNCIDDTLAGTGSYYIANSSSNFGVFEGNFTINTPTGSLGFNSGTIDASVVFDNLSCELGIEETETTVSVYPNPAQNVLYVSQSNLAYHISDMSGKVIASGTTNTSGIDVSGLAGGIYTITLQVDSEKISVARFVKQ